MNDRRRNRNERIRVAGQQPGHYRALLPAGRDTDLHGMHGEPLLTPAI